jgi:hydrogenase expression/formation protein HypD
MTAAREWLERIRSLDLPARFRIMNVCGGHERSITMAGLRRVLPEQIELIPGPGCPVCVCPEEVIFHAIQIALEAPATVVCFGDMLRVPVNVPKGKIRTLDQARAAGGDVRPIASPLEAVRIAAADPDRPVVFFAAGFETTAAPVAAMMGESMPPNLSLLLATRRTWPAVAMLLDSGEAGFDALIAPGHVATIMGPEEWEAVPERYNKPAAVAGFTSESLLTAIWSVLRQHSERRTFLDNCYPQLVRPGGNQAAQTQMGSVMRVADATWRGIGVIPDSGLELSVGLRHLDAAERFPLRATELGKRVGEMPPGCACADVVLGRRYPDQCALYGRACTPRTPVGPCMVSDEGACRIWWAGGTRTPREWSGGTPIAHTTAAE